MAFTAEPIGILCAALFPPAVMTPDATPSPSPWGAVKGKPATAVRESRLRAAVSMAEVSPDTAVESDSASRAPDTAGVNQSLSTARSRSPSRSRSHSRSRSVSASEGDNSAGNMDEDDRDRSDEYSRSSTANDDSYTHSDSDDDAVSRDPSSGPTAITDAAPTDVTLVTPTKSRTLTKASTVAARQQLTLAPPEDSPLSRARARLGSKTGDWTRYTVALAAVEGERMRKGDLIDERRRRLMQFHWLAVQSSVQVWPCLTVVFVRRCAV
jgi:hypothetical protein